VIDEDEPRMCPSTRPSPTVTRTPEQGLARRVCRTGHRYSRQGGGPKTKTAAIEPIAATDFAIRHTTMATVTVTTITDH
jgi:hypothetical protein